jgi:DNA-binding NarL/FixJ family response regulator
MAKKFASPPIRIALVEDDVVLLNSFVSAVESSPDMKLVSTANTLSSALQLLTQAPVDVLIIDLGLPDGSGIDVIRLAHSNWPDCAIMVSTTFADELNVMRSIEAGASGYLLKDSSYEKMMEEIRSLNAGGSPISPLIARQILTRFHQNDKPAIPTIASNNHTVHTSLSERELEVLKLITKGFTYDEIATLIEVSRNTVMTFVRRIYSKLEVKSKLEAIDEARNQGLIEN